MDYLLDDLTPYELEHFLLRLSDGVREGPSESCSIFAHISHERSSGSFWQHAFPCSEGLAGNFVGVRIVPWERILFLVQPSLPAFLERD